MTVFLSAVRMSNFTAIVHVWQWCITLPPYHLWGSWNCVFSKQFWAGSPDLTVPWEIECITLSLQYIYSSQLFHPLVLKSTAAGMFMQAVSEDLFLHKMVNRTDTAVIVSSQLFMHSAECPVLLLIEPMLNYFSSRLHSPIWERWKFAILSI